MKDKLTSAAQKISAPGWAIGIVFVVYVLAAQVPAIVEVIQAIQGNAAECSPLNALAAPWL